MPETPAPAPSEEAPGSTVGQFLAHRFRVLLGLRQVHPDDHFFHLGGDSLMGVHLIAGLKGVARAAVRRHERLAALLGGRGPRPLDIRSAPIWPTWPTPGSW
ncbi:phosphopantetheine-binding protein [Streptomyces sp. DSM 41524]|uniref:Phosphopantetheine-binding protein n=1 Tax=Streptomyces asiaticus subsp. ignotus TaxID=3098222 RepID=A0ABU7Q9W8_9ACTN|nr:phosphopantetheine-binding protein [Streptomyces sp. DSM 41524]